MQVLTLFIKNRPVSSKTFFLIGCLIATGHQTHAQKKNLFGVIVGVSASGMPDYDGKTTVGLTGGLYWERKLSKSLSFQSNFLYTQRGEREDIGTPELILQYINLPMMLKCYLTEDFQVMTGIYWDPLIGVIGDGYSMDDFKNSDFGIPIGVSHDLSNYFQLGLSYNFGLINISDTSTNSFTLRHNWSSVTLAILIR